MTCSALYEPYQKSALRCTQFSLGDICSHLMFAVRFSFILLTSHIHCCASLCMGQPPLTKTTSPTQKLNTQPNKKLKFPLVDVCGWCPHVEQHTAVKIGRFESPAAPTSGDSNLLWMLFIFYLHFYCQRCAVLISFDFWVKYN